MDILEIIGTPTPGPSDFSVMVAERAGFLVEGVAREKFLIDGEAYDVIMATRLPSDPWPED